MKTLFIPAKSKQQLNDLEAQKTFAKLPKNLAIAYSVQYKDVALKIKDILSKDHNLTLFSQVLGCSKLKLAKNTQAILLIGSGRFHGISLAIESKLQVYIFQENNVLSKVSKKDMEVLERKQKSAYIKFLNSRRIGILISTKPGQENLKRAINLKKSLQKKDKDSYLFISNNINFYEFENFQIQSWVNTACPRLDLNETNTNILNINQIK